MPERLVLLMAMAVVACRAPAASSPSSSGSRAPCVVGPQELTLTANVDDDDRDGRIDGLQEPMPDVADDDVARLLVTGDCQLRVEGAPAGEVRVSKHDAGYFVDVVRGRSAGWPGSATITAIDAGLIVVNAPAILLRHPNEAIREVWAVDVTDPSFEPTTSFLSGLEAALPPAVALRRLSGSRARADRWVQDAFQSASMNGRSVVLRLPRAGEARGLALLGLGELPEGAGTVATGVVSSSRFDFGGNVEVLAPHGSLPQGRLIIGGADEGEADPVSADLLAWLEAQGAQGPAIRVPTTWLASGHLDDLVMPLPSTEGVVRLALASTTDGLRVVGRSGPTQWQTRSFIDFNRKCQAHLDSAEAMLRAAVAPAKLEVVRLPVLFEAKPLATSVVPNPVNALVVGHTVVVGEPGPGLVGSLLKAEVEARYAAAGLTTKWVDVSAYLKRGGSVHCAVEAMR